MAIKSFKNRETRNVFNGNFSRKLPQQIQQRARERLKQIDAADNLEDLLIPPSNRLEQLDGDRSGQNSIRINQQYRICFEWEAGNALNVEITDYH